MSSRFPNILFRCDGSSAIGLGHVVRCLSIANQLKEEYGIASIFLLRSGESASRLIQQFHHEVIEPEDSSTFDYKSWLCGLADQTQAGALFLDVRDELPTSALEELRVSGILLVTIDDPSPRRLLADFAFYPPVPQVDQMDWADFKGLLFKGWDWIPLRKEVHTETKRSRNDQIRSLLVTTGGSDPAEMAKSIVRFLSPMEKDFETVVVAGPAFQHFRELEKAVAVGSGDFRLERHPENLPALMAEADLAIASFGVTAYELAAIGIPAAYLCLTADHQQSASSLVEAGLGISLGLFSELDESRFRLGIEPLMDSFQLREAMSQKGRQTVDGRGAQRIAKLIVERLEERVGND